MSQAQQPQVIVIESNGMGTAGFVLSLVGFLTCGLLSPVGLFFSLLGINKQPRGLAVAGTVLGVIGSLSLLVSVPFILRVSGISDAMEQIELEREQEAQREADERRIREEQEAWLKREAETKAKVDTLLRRNESTPSP